MEGSKATPDKVQTTTEGDGGPGVPEEARRDPEAPDSVQGAIAEARQKLEEGASLDDLATDRPQEVQLSPDSPSEEPEEPADELEEEPEAEETEEAAAEEIEKPHLKIPEDERIPEAFLEEHGFSYDDHGRLHRANGDFVSLQEHEELRQQAVAPTEAGEELEDAELEEEPEEGAEEDVEEIAPELLVEIPGREPEDPEVRIEAPDAETAERLHQLSKAAMRRKDYHEKMESVRRERRELDHFEDLIRADPAGVVLKVAPEEVRQELAIRLLEDEAVYETVSDKIETWRMDRNARRADLAEARENARERRQQSSRDARVRQFAREGARNARRLAEELVPADASPAARKKLLGAAMDDLGDHMLETGDPNISRDDAVDVLRETGTLELFGGEPGRSGAPSSEGGETSSSDASARRVRRVEPGSEEAKKAQRTSEELEEKAKRRRAAAGAPQGAGASAAAPVEPPEGQSVKERIQWVRERGGVSAVTGS